MGHKFSLRGIRAKTALIVLASMSVMLIFQGISIFSFINLTNRNRREYIRGAAESMAVSLNAVGDTIRSMAMYIASFDSFKTLYFPDRAAMPENSGNPVDMLISAFHSIRFIANYYPVIRDVAVVGLDKIPFSYYLGTGYEFMDLMEGEYNFADPNAVESRFFYFSGQDFFIYVTPVSGSYSAAANTQKIASCIFICNLDYVREIFASYTVDGELCFSVYDSEGRFIISSGPEPGARDDVIEIISMTETMGIRIVVSRGRASGISGVLGNIFPGRDEVRRFIGIFFTFSIFLLLLVTATVILLLQKQITGPISALVEGMVTRDHKPQHIRLPRSNMPEVDRIAEGVNNLLSEIAAYTENSLKTQEKMYRLELARNEAEIYALQSQINPHFLNNTLQCIRSIAISRGVDEIAAITLSMSELFRYSMNYQEQVLIRDEVEIVRHFVVITNIRFQNRFSFLFDIKPEILDVPMGRMILQPLVENAVRHGVSRREEGGLVEIRGERDGDVIMLEVRDNGPGFGDWRLTEIQHQLAYSFEENREIKKESSFGLYNIDRRIKLHYGAAYGLEIGHKENRTLVRIRFPDTTIS
ncbi:MAG: sensor histidine kinase [Treponema sp.]|jgi:two-component system sensor histidine kinase YesM|nr:sensor histidine kinase [Treponema sp.]